MSDSEYPAGPLPADLEATLLAVVRDVGVTVSEKVLRKRVEAHYKIEFTSHKDALRSALRNVLATPEVQVLMAKAQQEKAKEVGGKGKKRGRSPSSDKKDKKDGKDKKEKKEKKEKKPKDYPKAPLTAFLLFSQDQRDKLRKENPTWALSEVAKTLGKLWKDIEKPEGERYAQLAEADKKRHEREMKEYLAKGGEVFKARRGKKEKKEKHPVKRATPAFMYFTQDFRSTHRDLPMTEQAKQAGAAWKVMTPEAKAPYEAKAAKDKERYATEMAAHKAAH